MASVFFRLDGAFLTGCTWGYDRLHPAHLARRQANLDAVRVRRLGREECATCEFDCGVVVLLQDAYSQAGLNLGTEWRHVMENILAPQRNITKMDQKAKRS